MQALRKIADKFFIYPPDPSVFNDEIASQTSWSAISNSFFISGLSGGYKLARFTNKRGYLVLGYRLKVLSSLLLSIVALFGFSCVILFLSSILIFMSDPDVLVEPNMIGFIILLFFLSSLSLWLCYIAFTHPSKRPLFDENDRSIRYGDNKIFFYDVYAIQLNPTVRYIQLNLVLRDASRIALKNYMSLDIPRQDALQIADYIGLPTTRIWDRSVGLQ